MRTPLTTAQSFEMRVGNDVRRYTMVSAVEGDLATSPIIIDLHGSGSSPEEHLAVTAAHAMAGQGAVVVLPQADIPFRLLPEWPTGWAWNVPGSPLPGETEPRQGPDDVEFIGELIAEVVQRHGAHPSRIHLRGYSGGARLSAHLAARFGDSLASVCFVSGVRFVDGGGKRPPVLALHGRRDHLNPYDGGAGSRWSESVESAVQRWAGAVGCEPVPTVRAITETIHAIDYRDSTGFAAVRLIRVDDAEHAWPGTQDRDHIEQFGCSGHLDASQAHLDFIHDVENQYTDSFR